MVRGLEMWLEDVPPYLHAVLLADYDYFFFQFKFCRLSSYKKKKKPKDLNDLMNYEFNNMTMLHI